MNLNTKHIIALSLIPLIYVLTSLENAIVAGLVLVVVTMIIKLLSLFINNMVEGRFRTYTYMILATALVTVISIILNTYFTTFELVTVYLALIILNIENVYEKKETSVLKQLLISGITFVLIILIGLIRELLGTGTLTLAMFGLETITVFAKEFAIAFLTKNSGGFVVAGFIIAMMNTIDFKKESNDVI